LLILVNLDSAIERRDLMTLQLDALGVAFERLGIDMRARSDGEITAWVEAHFPNFSFDLASLSGAEVGCWLSHLSAWKRLLEDGHAESCIVIEDDLTLAADFPDAIAALEAQSAFDFVFLGTSSKNLSARRRTRIGRFWAHAPVGAIYNTWGYVVTRAYVRRLFRDAPVRLNIPIDHFVGGTAAAAGPRIAVLRPAVVDEHPIVGTESQIGPYTKRLDRWRLVEMARRRLLSSRVSALYYALYRFL
jgi:glycosyl transferase, family 25